jgi:hypothetical protein
MNINKRKLYSQEEICFLKENYPLKGGRFCAEKLKRTLSSIHNICKKQNISVNVENLPAIFESVYKKENKNFNVNADLFITPTIPSVIYTLGLLWADGTINIQKNYLREVSLKSTFPDGDEFFEIMTSFGKWNYYKYDIVSPHYKKLKPSIQIKTNNRPLVDFLTSVGYSPNSTDSPTKILNLIPLELRHYWFRGFFDGDGSLYVKNRCIQVVFSGNINQDWKFLTSILIFLGVSYSEKQVRTKKGHSSFIRFTGAKNCKIFLDFMYSGANSDKIYLSRKYQKYLAI